MIKLIRWCIGLWGLLFLPALSLAATSEAYQIELIVYSHITDAGLKSEYWPKLPALYIPSQAEELAPEQIFPESQWQLKNLHRKLEKNNFHILLHTAWQESIDDLRKGKTI